MMIACRGLCAVLMLGVCGPAVAAEPQTFEDCEGMIRTSPDSFDGYDCLAGMPRSNGRWEEARRRLQGYVAADPDNHLARFGLAALESSQGRDEAEPLFLTAIEGLARQGKQVEHVRARLTLAVFYLIRGRDEEAEVQLESAAEVAASLDDRILLARVRNIQGRAAERRNELGRAWYLFKEVEAQIFPDGPPGMQAFCLAMLGILCERMGRIDQAVEYHRRAAEIQHAAGDYWAEARSRGNVARHVLERWNEGHLSREQALVAVRKALDAAVAADTRSSEIRLRADLAALLPMDQALAELNSALAMARELRDALGIGRVLRDLALTLAAPGEDPQAALRHLEEALRLGRARGDRADVGRTLMARAAIHDEQGRREQAVADLAEAAAAVEALRDLQKDELIQSRFFSQWVTIYHRLVGLHLEASDGDPEAIERAFAVSERMRARALLDSLDAARATSALAPSGPLTDRRAELLDRIGVVQKKLLGAELDEGGRGALLDELDKLEVEERAVREELARASPVFRRLRSPEFPSVEEIRGVLGEDEALLSFQIASGDYAGRTVAQGPRGGGSWLLSLTRTSARAYPLPEPRRLEPAIRVFSGVVARRDGSDAEPAARLYETLLAPALRELPAGIRHLILVPEGPLHHLPFAALRASPRDEPLGTRFRLSRIPSATTWRAWRTEASPAQRRPALVLADPLPGDASEEPAQQRAWYGFGGERLGPLPRAREEARFLRRRFGDGSEVLVGRAASESRVKTDDLTRFGVLHFAAHAIVDDENPARSAVLLAPGDNTEDGLLQIREVVGLHLQQAVVVLSACRSASGVVVEGEGVLGLARAFLQAGARSVVGTLWPLRDDEAEAFFRPFYERLARGETLDEALRAARRDRIHAGAPASAWAGVVLLGEGETVPGLAARVSRIPRPLALVVVVVAGAIVAGVLLALRRSRSHPPHTSSR